MTKVEFENRPCIDAVDGKNQVANLYDMFGIRVFQDMEQTAKEAQELEDYVLRLRSELDATLGKLNALKIGKNVLTSHYKLIEYVYTYHQGDPQ